MQELHSLAHAGMASVKLSHVKQLVVVFNPLDALSRSARELLRVVSADKLKELYPRCEVRPIVTFVGESDTRLLVGQARDGNGPDCALRETRLLRQLQGDASHR